MSRVVIVMIMKVEMDWSGFLLFQGTIPVFA
jgi:hypothetical protein